MIPPVNSAVTVTIGTDLMPIRYRLRKSSLRSKSRRTVRRTIAASSTAKAPSSETLSPTERERAAKGGVACALVSADIGGRVYALRARAHPESELDAAYTP